MIKALYLFIFIFVCLCQGIRADDVGGIQEELEEVLEEAYATGKNLYEKLPSPGKFAAGAGVGYFGSKIAVNTAVSSAKIAGAAFIVSEALNYAGVFDGISQDSKAAINKVKNSALKSVNNARKTLRRRLAPKGIKNTIKAALTTEKLATCGVAAGAFLGLMA